MEQEIKNQHLVGRPCHLNVRSAGSQCELGPQLVNQLTEATHSQHFNQRQHLGKDWQCGIRSSKFVLNYILGEGILSIPNDQRNTRNALPLALQLNFTEGVSRTRQPCVSSLSRWSRAKCLTPWKCLKTSCGPCINTETSLRQMRQKNGSVCQLHL